MWHGSTLLGRHGEAGEEGLDAARKEPTRFGMAGLLRCGGVGNDWTGLDWLEWKGKAGGARAGDVRAD